MNHISRGQNNLLPSNHDRISSVRCRFRSLSLSLSLPLSFFCADKCTFFFSTRKRIKKKTLVLKCKKKTPHTQMKRTQTTRTNKTMPCVKQQDKTSPRTSTSRRTRVCKRVRHENKKYLDLEFVCELMLLVLLDEMDLCTMKRVSKNLYEVVRGRWGVFSQCANYLFKALTIGFGKSPFAGNSTLSQSVPLQRIKAYPDTTTTQLRVTRMLKMVENRYMTFTVVQKSTHKLGSQGQRSR